MNDLVKIVETSGLEKQEGQSIIEKFGSYEAVAKEWEGKARLIKVTDVSQTTEMAMAKEARKKFSNLRIDVEKSRKALKEQSLRKGQAIDAIARFLFSLISPIETYLKEQEDFIEIQTAKRIEAERIATEKKLEEERIAKEKAEAEEQERIRKENEKLRKEAEEKEKALALERARVEKERQIEREKAEKERIALEEKARKEAEEKRIAKEKLEKMIADKEREKIEAKRAEEARLAKIEEEKKEALKQPDKEKYIHYIGALLDIEVPQIKDDEIACRVSEIISFLKSKLKP